VHCQELTQEEVWATDLALYHSTEVWYYKAPLDSMLPALVLPALPVFAPLPVRTPRLQFELDYGRGLGIEPAVSPISHDLRMVDSDFPIWVASHVDDRTFVVGSPAPIPEHLIRHQIVVDSDTSTSATTLRLAQLSTIPRVLVSLSPGLSTGRGLPGNVWSWRSTACNATEFPQHIDQGDIEMVANSVGIPTIGYGEASTSNQLFINRSAPVVGTQMVQGAAGLLTILIASDVITASGIWGAVAGGVFYAAGKVVEHFKSVTPADLTTRFAGTTILVDNFSATLAPHSQPNHCASWEFFARYSGKNAVARSGIPIY